MSDLSKFIPTQSKTVKAIFAHYKKEGDNGHMSKTLPVSLIGHPCERYLWYVFRQCCRPKFDGRMYRLFETGELEEARFVKNLRDIGCEVHDVDQNGKQFKVIAFGGHLKGYMDGCARGIPEAPKTWHVLEFKTHNAKSYRELTRKGVKETKPQHYAQMMVYMHLTGMKRALYLAVNKDNDDLYAERIRYDKKEAEALMERAKRIITTSTLPSRIANRPDDYRCNWCDAQIVCWGGGDNEPALSIPSLSCRQCCHVTPIIEGEDGKWKCRQHGLLGSDTKIVRCHDYLILPGLISFAEPTNYGQDAEGNDYIEFTNKDGTTWKTGPASGCYSSVELTKVARSCLGNAMVKAAKDVFGADIVECDKEILSRYPEEDSRIIWKGPAKELGKAWREHYGNDLAEQKPIARFNNSPVYDSAELSGGRVVITWGDGTAEIREGVE